MCTRVVGIVGEGFRDKLLSLHIPCEESMSSREPDFLPETGE